MCVTLEFFFFLRINEGRRVRSFYFFRCWSEKCFLIRQIIFQWRILISSLQFPVMSHCNWSKNVVKRTRTEPRFSSRLSGVCWFHSCECGWTKRALSCPADEALCLVVVSLSQLDNVDEQAAQIRRELDGRLQLADKISRVRRTTTLHRATGVFILTENDCSWVCVSTISWTTDSAAISQSLFVPSDKHSHKSTNNEQQMIPLLHYPE